MTEYISCPVCGHNIKRTYYTEESIGIVEDYASCDYCGYCRTQGYSPLYEGIDSRNLKYVIRWLFRYRWHKRNKHIKLRRDIIEGVICII